MYWNWSTSWKCTPSVEAPGGVSIRNACGPNGPWSGLATSPSGNVPSRPRLAMPSNSVPAFGVVTRASGATCSPENHCISITPSDAAGHPADDQIKYTHLDECEAFPVRPLTIGIRPPHDLFDRGAAALREGISRIEAAGIDRVCVGDHVSFHGGRGFDGLVQATALGAISDLEVQTAVYLLPLRHPVPVARQVNSLAQIAPGRFVFGVGIGGEDPNEIAMCGVDPTTRGRRMDESMDIVRRLLSGEAVTVAGEFFDIT